MKLFRKFIALVVSIFRNTTSNEENLSASKDEDKLLNDIVDMAQGESLSTANDNNEQKITFGETLRARLGRIKQDINSFKNTFPDKFKEFSSRIDELSETYCFSLEGMQRRITFEIDPDSNSSIIRMVEELEQDVKSFIENEVKYKVLDKRLQRLLMKVNIIYNVSIFYFNKQEKEKIYNQIIKASDLLKDLIKEIQGSEYILMDRRLKERMINLVAYVDYEILKVKIRTACETPANIINELVSLNVFDKFNYEIVFSSFIKDELNNLLEILELIKDTKEYGFFQTRLTKLLTAVIYMGSTNKLLESSFWDEFLNLESDLLEYMKLQGAEDSKTKIQLIGSMNINVQDSDVLDKPYKIAMMSLINIYQKTHDNRIMILIKFVKNLSEEITYKEIYYLVILFDTIELIKTVPNKLILYIEKYIIKYPYDDEKILHKKEKVFQATNKTYVLAFSQDGDTSEISNILEKLKIDFRIKDDKVYINNCYFEDLKNVIGSLTVKYDMEV